MARPKFKPNETPIENYQENVINWSMITVKYATPIGPEQRQYDPYYMYSVIADHGGQYAESVWFVNVDEHKIIQKAGATANSVMAATYVMEGKRRGLVIVHSSGPQVQRSEEQVEQETATALAQLAGVQAEGGDDQALAQYGGMMGPPAPVHQPPTVTPPAPGVATGMAQTPSSGPMTGVQGQIPSPPAPQLPAANPTPERPAPGISGPQGMTSSPPAPKPTPPAPKPAPKPEYIEPYVEQKVYTPMSEVEMDAFKAYWKDIAALHVWAYYQLPEVVKELDLPKVKPTDQREMATSINIETWRQMGRGRSPLPGWVVRERPEPPADPTTKDGALRVINELVPGAEEEATYFIKRWLNLVIAPVDNLENWKHAANIAKLFGLDGQVLFAEHDADHLMMLTQAIWMYADGRDDGFDRNTVLLEVSNEYGLPKELMQFEEIVEDDEEPDEEPVF